MKTRAACKHCSPPPPGGAIDQSGRFVRRVKSDRLLRTAGLQAHLCERGGVVEGGQQVELQHLRDLPFGITEDVGPLRLPQRRKFLVLQVLRCEISI